MTSEQRCERCGQSEGATDTEGWVRRGRYQTSRTHRDCGTTRCMYDIGSWTGGVCRDTAVGQYGGQIKSPQYKIGGYNTGPEFGSDRVADYAERYIIIPVCQKHAGIMRTVEKNAIRRDEDRKRKAASREVANERYQVNSERVTKGLAILDESHPNLGATKLPGTNGTMVKIDINALLGALGIKQAV